jgi:ketosteroid isomerase-like protein
MDISPDTKKETDVDPTLLAIWEVFRQFKSGLANGDANMVADCYCMDAQFMIPNRPAIIGRDNIKAAIAGYITRGFTQYECTSLMVYGSAGIIGTQNTYTLSQAGGNNMDIGKALHLWKTENGYWKIYRDCFNSDLPAPRYI